tara:strand:- start:537 stop:773 length:237 start_codon:yes stop_codon:yes gene_type:complete
MDSVNTDDRVESFLSVMLEGYEGSLVNVNNFIEQTTEQLDGAIGQREEIENKISELKDLLGLEEETEAPKLELVKEES